VHVAANATRRTLVPVGLGLSTIPQYVGDLVATESQAVYALVSPVHSIQRSGGDGIQAPDAEGKVHLTAFLKNEGNGVENLTVSPRNLPPGASIALPPTLALPIGGSSPISVDIAVSNRTAPGLYPIDLTLASDDGAAIPWHVELKIAASPRVELFPGSRLQGLAGRETVVPVQVENAGNVELALPGTMLAPEGWTVSLTTTKARLAPGEFAPADLRVRSPPGTSGDFALRSDPSWASDTPLPWSSRTVDLKANVTVEAGAVTATVRNDGTGDASDVVVALYEGDRRIDEFVLPRLPAGGASRAILSTSGGTAGAPAEIRIDDKGAFGRPIVLPIQLEQAPTPSPQPLLWVAAVAVVGAHLAKRRKERSR
jgi:hypothetical protein